MLSDICRELEFTLSEKAYSYGSLDKDDIEDITETNAAKGTLLEKGID